ncbi:MAG: ABC transporter permease [Bacteroidales bacterium]|nr:ABC transporter permease [Bacteroidales bacterium]
MKNITWTIVRKEFFRFFKDRSLFFTVVIMPGLLIFLIYTFIGDNMGKQFEEDTSVVTPVYVDRLPAELQPLFDSLPYALVTQGFDVDNVKKQLKDKDNDLLYVAFPKGFTDSIAHADGNTACVPNVQIFYNSSSPNSMAAFSTVSTLLNDYESTLCAPCNRFDINVDENILEGGTEYNSGNVSDEIGSVLATLLPMLIIMMLFSACMSVAPTSIAGEKERGTIATLLVTPMPRNQLALGKILSLSGIALLSGLSSFLGIILSLPKMITGESDEKMAYLANETRQLYTANDYVLLLVIILTTVLLLVGLVSVVSAWAKNVKSAQTMTLPLMIVVMAASFTPMLGSDATAAAHLIPFYGSVQCMASVFKHEATLLPFLVTVGSNLAYTAATIVALTRMFGSEKVMFSK